MLDGKCFKPMFRFCSHLGHTLEKDDCAIGMSDKATAKLCQQLGSEFYTYLVLSDNLSHEVISVCYSEGILYVERGLDATDRQRWPCGTSISFEATLSAWVDAKALVEEDIDTSCPPELYTGEIKNGNCTLEVEDGVVVRSVPNKKQLQDGCYERPITTIKDGCIVDIGEGSGYPLMAGCCG